MGLRELEEKLRSQAEKERKDVIGQAEREAREIIQGYQNELDHAYETGKTRELSLAKNKAKGIVGRARITAMQDVSQAKRKVLDEVYESACKRILEAPKKEKKKIIKGWLSRTPDLGKGSRILVDPEYRSLLPKTKHEIKEADVGDFGFIMESGDSAVKSDMTLNNLLEREKAGLDPELSHILWEDE